MRSIIRAARKIARRAGRRAASILKRLSDARQRRRLREIEFNRSLNQYRGSIGLPALPDDDPILF